MYMVLNRVTIFDYVYNKVKAYDSNIEVTGVISNTPSSFPAVFVREISAVQDEQNVTFAFDDTQHISTFEVNIYTAKEGTGSSQAQSIMDVVCTAFKELYFIMIMREPIDNLDTTIYRLTARFRRIIGGGDTISTQ